MSLNCPKNMDTKICFKCGRELHLSEFYKHPRMGDGHLNKCKDCTKHDVRLRYYCNMDDPKMPAGQQRVLVDAECAYAIKVQRLIERANRSATHAQEACITQVSYAKEEMSLARKGF